MAQAARVRKPLGQWRKLGLYAGALRVSPTSVNVLQLPYEEGARWAALGFDEQEKRPPAGRVSLVLNNGAASPPGIPAANKEWVGLLLDEWTELIPYAEEEAGLVFHYDGPGAQAPQAVLVAVLPQDTDRWREGDLIDTLNQTLDLAKIRAVDRDLLGDYGQILPMMYLAANSANDTVATTFYDCLEEEPQLAT
jgi:hypothetical protein